MPNALTFNAVDVETANADRSSICQVGIAQVQDGNICDEWKTLINPEEWFDPFIVNKIHGIDEERVQNAPSFPKVYDEICRRVQGSVLVSHTSIDRTAINRAAEKYGLEQLQVTWLDSFMVARRAWPDRHGKGAYGLKNLAADLDISFRHHDALEDAKAAARIVIAACRQSKLDVQGWLQKLAESRPSLSSRPRSAKSLKREGNPNGSLYGVTVAFTGTLKRGCDTVSKHDAADLAAEVGCNVRGGVTNAVTILIVGIQNIDRLKGYDKSKKHRDAEARGIEILSSDDFFALIDFCRQ